MQQYRDFSDDEENTVDAWKMMETRGIGKHRINSVSPTAEDPTHVEELITSLCEIFPDLDRAIAKQALSEHHWDVSQTADLLSFPGNLDFYKHKCKDSA